MGTQSGREGERGRGGGQSVRESGREGVRKREGVRDRGVGVREKNRTVIKMIF